MYYLIKTYGCQMNVHESEKIAGMLQNLGYTETFDDHAADVIVFNTCCIRETAEAKIKGHIGELKRLKTRKPDLIIAICGCMSQQEGVAEGLKKRFPFIDIILGTSNLHLLSEKIRNISNKKLLIDTELSTCTEELASFRTSLPNGWVNIIYGCNNFCTYCIVPYVRGRERSRSMTAIIDEVRGLVQNGYKEITLLGQNVNSYGNDLTDGSNFAKLLREVAKIEGKFRVRFMTSHPKDLSDEVIDAIAESPKICKYIHLPVQSGSNKVLHEMNRKYTREHYFELIDKIRAKIPNAGISADIMVGFPNESQGDFDDTIDLVNRVRFSSLYCFIYSRRKGTVTYSMENQIEKSVKTARIKQLIATQNRITREISENYYGKVIEILVEDKNDKYVDTYCGRTDCGRLVNVKSKVDLIGQFINVKIKGSQSATLWGDIVE